MRRPLVASLLFALTSASAFVGCAGRPPEAKAPPPVLVAPAPSVAGPAAPAETRSELAWGEIAPVEHADPIPARLVARYLDGDYETLALDIVLPIPAAFNALESGGTVVSLDGDGAKPYAFAALPDDVSVIEGRGVGAATLWVRRAASEQGAPLSGHLYTPQLDHDPGHHVRFRGDLTTPPSSNRKVLPRWAAAFALHLKGLGEGPWNRFAAARVLEVFGGQATKPETTANLPAWRDRLTSLMETTTGVVALQESLQQDRPLLLVAHREPLSLPLAKLTPPATPPHPWAEMLAGLGRSVPSEPLAAAAPASCWYLRASDVATVFRIADELDRFGSPAVRLAQGDPLERSMFERYETALGLQKTALARALGGEVIASVALVGSDPYLREGSDLTALFQLKHPALFDAALEATLGQLEKSHGALTRETLDHHGVPLSAARSADGSVQQWRARIGDLAMVSNSRGAITRVLDAQAGRIPKLADEPDFRYMMARDGASGPSALAFMGDRFVTQVVGPQQKVLEARRQVAAAELMTPGFAALLYGFIYGKSPTNVDELLRSKLLRKQELTHSSGGAIVWTPGQAARSVWGTPSALTPLGDLAAVQQVSASERIAYDRFARAYQSNWSSYIDPATMKISFEDDGSPVANGAPRAWSAALRVLPLIDGSEYNDVRELAGQARVVVPPLAVDGLRAVVGIGPSAGVRRELADLAGGVGGRHGLKVDFLGEWAMAGVVDRLRISNIVTNLGRDLPEVPTTAHEPVDELAEMARAPVYAAVAIRSASGAALALSALRLAAKDALGDNVSWSELGPERDVPIVRVSIAPQHRTDAMGQRDVALFYALMSDVWLMALDESALRALVTEAVEGRGPKPGAAKEAGAQLVVDLAAAPQGGLLTVAGWLLSTEVRRDAQRGRAQAEALLRGAPESAGSASALRKLGFAYLGGVPVPPNGGAYTLTQTGVEDPAFGTRHAPRWPKLPVAGSPTEALLGALGVVRSEVQFDDEGKDPRSGRAMQSLHVKTSVAPHR